MGSGMTKVLEGLYVGSMRDAKDRDQLKNNNITHILAIHDSAKEEVENMTYLCIRASDTPGQDLSQFFRECIDFIHGARVKKKRVLVHCLAGVSRSVTITAAYLMTVTELGWRDSINAVRGSRNTAHPNYGFQKQLQNYESENLDQERKRLRDTYPECPYNDTEQSRVLMEAYRKFVYCGDPNSKEDGLYNLPHNAYGDRNKRQGMTEEDLNNDKELAQSDSQSDKDTDAKSEKSENCRTNDEES